MRYTKEELMDLPLNILQGIDITNKEEEDLVQGILNQKRLASPEFLAPITFPSSATDGITKEKELELQAKIDARQDEIRKSLTAEEVETVEEPAPEPEPLAEPAPVLLEPIPEAVSDIKCIVCGSRSFRHKEDCASQVTAVV